MWIARGQHAQSFTSHRLLSYHSLLPPHITMAYTLRTMGIDLEALKEAIFTNLGVEVKEVELVGKNEYCKTINVTLRNGKEIIARILSSSLPNYVMESEAATMKYVATQTSIPVSRVLHLNLIAQHPLGVYMLLEKIPGVKLATIFSSLTGFEQELIVAQVARWGLELFRHRFDAIGSLYSSKTDEFHVGPIIRPPFYVDGRDNLKLERGPFSTAREYFAACAQRELDCARTQSTQNTSDNYQRDVEDARFTVERSMVLLLNAIRGCRGLDDEDPELKPFSLSLADLDLSKIYVSAEEPSRIVSLPVWYAVTTRPLWHCARIPSWLTVSLSEEGGINKFRLEKHFRKVIQDVEGPDSLFLRTLDLEDTRRAIDDVCEYDAFRDGFLLLPTLESIIATLPGEEDVAGLQALLDPNTLEGRAARIALLTRGSGPLSLATRGDVPFDHKERPVTAVSGRSGGLLMA